MPARVTGESRVQYFQCVGPLLGPVAVQLASGAFQGFGVTGEAEQ